MKQTGHKNSQKFRCSPSAPASHESRWPSTIHPGTLRRRVVLQITLGDNPSSWQSKQHFKVDHWSYPRLLSAFYIMSMRFFLEKKSHAFESLPPFILEYTKHHPRSHGLLRDVKKYLDHLGAVEYRAKRFYWHREICELHLVTSLDLVLTCGEFRP